MTTLYVRTFNLKDSLSDEEVLAHWHMMMEKVVPAVKKVQGTRSIKIYSGAGALRAQITLLWEMDDAGVYERGLHDADVRQVLGKMYGDWDLTTASQSFHREVTSELIRALSGG